MNDYDGDRGTAQGTPGSYTGDGATPIRTPVKGGAEAAVSLEEVNMHTNAMHAQLDNGASMESDSDPSMHRFNNFGASRMQRANSVRQVGRGMSVRDASMDDDGLPAPDSPQGGLMSARAQRGPHSRRDQPRGSGLATAGGSFSAMSDYEVSGGRCEPPLAPSMRSQVRSIRSGEGDRMRGHSPRRAPATPGSVRSVGTANGSARGESRSMHDQVCPHHVCACALAGGINFISNEMNTPSKYSFHVSACFQHHNAAAILLCCGAGAADAACIGEGSVRDAAAAGGPQGRLE